MDGLRSRANDRAGIKIKEPKSLEDREEVASECARKMKLSIPFLIDNMDNKTMKDYGTWPDRIYIVGKDGKVAYQGDVGPRGFSVYEAERRLKRILGK